MNSQSLSRFIWLSIAAAVVTISLKSLAYFVTGSVGLLSDALESIINLVAAVFALFMLKLAEKPADKDHLYGHTKAEYFSSIFEGTLIVIAAVTIGYSAVERLYNPQPIQQATIGIGISAISTLINLVVALTLLRVGNKYKSITLVADGHHLMTDVWTSIGVVAGVALVWVTDIQIIDPIVALVVAANIIRTGYYILRQSMMGLLDVSLPEDEMRKIKQILKKYHETNGISFHGLRSRQSATRKFMSVHILVPGTWSVQKGHDLLEEIEKDLRNSLPGITVFTHLEPIEDPKSHEDISLDRVQ
ncbi:cation transporter [Candidatus Roizmanbacteria bacterium]|nr:MAG: cation transporter [Candidatus Roizmanbacteria bacterium]